MTLIKLFVGNLKDWYKGEKKKIQLFEDFFIGDVR